MMKLAYSTWFRMRFQLGALWVVRWLLGATFMASGFLKLIGPTDAANLFMVLGLTPRSVSFYIAISLSVLELIVGVLLIFNRSVRLVSFSVVLFLGVSTLVAVALIPGPIPCGCFGSLLQSNTDEMFLMRNFILLGLVLFLLWGSSSGFENNWPLTISKTDRDDAQ